MGYAIIARSAGGPEVLERVDYDPGMPPPGHVLLQHTAIGVNFIDVYYRRGLYPWQDSHILIPGSEAVGIVDAVGEGVNFVSEGDRVGYAVANGAYTSHRIIGAQHVVPIPPGVPDNVAAASLLKGLTVHYLLEDSYPVEPATSVLFHAAAGGVGLIAGQWLRHLGIRAIGTAGGPEKCAVAKKNGYAFMVDYKNTAFVDAVLGITDGKGVDVVYDSVGADTYPGSLQCLKTFGTLVNFGQSSGPALDFKLSDLAVGSFTVKRPILFHYTKNTDWLRNAAKDLFSLISEGKIKISVGNSFRLEEAADAHRLLETRASVGSTVLIP